MNPPILAPSGDAVLTRTCPLCGHRYFLWFKRRHLRRHVAEMLHCELCRGQEDLMHRPCYHPYCTCKCSPLV